MVSAVAGKVRCLRCGGDELGRDGYRVRKDGIVPRYYCKKCGLRFPESYKQGKKVLLQSYMKDIVYKFVVEKETLKSIREQVLERVRNQIKDFDISETYLNHIIIEEAMKFPSWREHLQIRKIWKKFRYVMGIDLTVIKIKKRKYQLLMIFDIPSRIPLVYTILPDKRVSTIVKVLEELKAAGYIPHIVVSDMERCLIEAIRRVYGNNVPIQWCLYHIKRYLDKYMPNREKMGNEIRSLQNKVKTKIMEIAYAPNREKQQKLVKELEELVKSTIMPKRIQRAIENFLEKLKYCHPRNEFYKLGGDDKSYYNNLCENAMGRIKEIVREKHGFKNVEVAQAYINVYWHHTIEEILHDEDLQPEREKFNPTLQLFLDSEKINLAEISKHIDVDLRLLKEKAEQLGLKVIGSYAFKKEYLERKYEELIAKRPKIVEEASKILNLDLEMAQQILNELGIKIKYENMDVKKAKLIYPQTPPNSDICTANASFPRIEQKKREIQTKLLIPPKRNRKRKTPIT